MARRTILVSAKVVAPMIGIQASNITKNVVIKLKAKLTIIVAMLAIKAWPAWFLTSWLFLSNFKIRKVIIVSLLISLSRYSLYISRILKFLTIKYRPPKTASVVNKIAAARL